MQVFDKSGWDGWRGQALIDTNLVYCKKWELEDEQETLLFITVRALQESMKGVFLMT